MTNNQGKFLSALAALLAKHDATITISTDWGNHVSTDIDCAGEKMSLRCLRTIDNGHIKQILREPKGD